MANSAEHRKVLFFGDEASIQNLLRVFSQKLERKSVGAARPAAALASLGPQEFDSVLVDLRCSKPNRRLERGLSGIEEIRPHVVGRVLTIVAEISDRDTLVLIERYLLKGLPRSLHWLISER